MTGFSFRAKANHLHSELSDRCSGLVSEAIWDLFDEFPVETRGELASIYSTAVRTAFAIERGGHSDASVLRWAVFGEERRKLGEEFKVKLLDALRQHFSKPQEASA